MAPVTTPQSEPEKLSIPIIHACITAGTAANVGDHSAAAMVWRIGKGAVAGTGPGSVPLQLQGPYPSEHGKSYHGGLIFFDKAASCPKHNSHHFHLACGHRVGVRTPSGAKQCT